MRTIFAAALAVSAIVAPAAESADSRVGAQGGASFSTLAIAGLDSGLSTDGRPALEAGVRLEVSLGRRIALVTAPAIVRRGGAVVEATLDQRLSFETRYIDLPVLLKVSPTRGAVRPYLLAGASFAWRREARIALSVGGEVLADDDAAADVRATDVILQAGGGLDLEVGDRVRFFAEGVYGWGLRGLDAGDSLASDFIDAKNRGGSARAGFTFRLGR